MSDPRESPEWAEWERLLSDLLISACADEDSMPEDDGRYPDDLFDERHAALDAYVLRLLAERGELRAANARLKNDWTRMEAALIDADERAIQASRREWEPEVDTAVRVLHNHDMYEEADTLRSRAGEP